MRRIRYMWTYIVNLGMDGLMDHDAKKKVCVGVNKLSVIIALINAFLGPISFFFTKNLPLFLVSLLEIISMAAPIILNYFKKYRQASMTLYVLVCLATCYFCCLLGRLVEGQLAIVYLVGVSLFIFDDFIKRILFILLAVAVLVVVEINFKYEFVQPLVTSAAVGYFLRWASYLVIIFLVVFTFDLHVKNSRFLLRKVEEYANSVEEILKREKSENIIKDKFISKATHEMRVSFYSIFAIINILYKLEKKSDTTKFKECVDDLKTACKYSQSIIDNILEYERLKARIDIVVYNQLIDIRGLLMGIVDIYKYLANEKRVKLLLYVSEDISSHVIGDEVKIRQIATNIIHNAIKFTRSDTSVKIRVSRRFNNLLLSIEDRGEGVKGINPDSIFDAFVTRNPEGLGLGLYIVKETVNSLEGNISISNSTSEGTTFEVSLPWLELQEEAG